MQRLIENKSAVVEEIKINSSLRWLIKRTLLISLKYINSHSFCIAIDFIDKFAIDLDMLYYLIEKGSLL